MLAARSHVVLALYLALRAGAADFCAATTSSGARIDLSTLASGDYVVSEQTGDVYLSVCGGITREVYHVEDPAKVGAYRDGESLGDFTTELEPLSNDAGASLRYVNGATCSSQSSVKQSTTLLFDCDRSGSLPIRPVPIRVPTSDACAHVFMFSTPLACSGAQPRSWSLIGSIFSLLGWVLLAIASIFGVSALYHVFVLKEPAVDSIGPAIAKLREGALFAKDMIGIVALTVFDKLRGLLGGIGGSRGRDGFRGLDDDGSGPGRALLSDEDDDFS